MNTTTFAEFEARAKEQGFDEVISRDWPPNSVLATHTHPFGVSARVVLGEMWLTVGDHTQHLVAGQKFELRQEEPHAERYGALGATYWAARRHGRRTETK